MNVRRAVAARSNVAALEGILVSAKENTVEFSSYNMEFGIKTEIEAVVDQIGSIVVPAKIFCDIVSKLPENDMQIQTGQNDISIKCGQCDFSIIGIPCEDFPKLPTIEGEKPISLPSEIVRSLVSQTVFAVGDDENNSIHSGVLIETKGKTINFVAVDGFRLALRKENVDIKENLKIVVPGKTLYEALRLISQDDSEIKLYISERYVFFEINKYIMISRILEGEFINYEATIPSESTTKVRVSVRKFIECVERVSLIVNDRLKNPVKAVFEPCRINFSCVTSLGRSSDVVNAEFEGEIIEIAFNDKYMTEALKNSGTDEIIMQFSGSLCPIKITPIEGDSFLFLVLPVRLREDS
jgi:DNA polymerase-3 subunit beta